MTSTSRQLGEVCTIIAGQHIEAALYSTVRGGSPYLTGPADFGELRPMVSKWTNSPKVFAAEGDVLITVKGNGVGKTNLGCEAAIGRQLMALRPKDGELNQAYLFQYLRAAESRIFRLADGATVPGIGKDDLASLSVFLPPLQEQLHIAEVLDRAEALRAKRRSALTQLDTLTQAIFLDLFGDPATNPKGWQVSQVADSAEVQGGLQVSTARRNHPRQVPYLRVANVFRGFLDLREIKILRATDAEVARTTLVRDDLLIVEGHGNPDEIGRGALWDGSIIGCVHQNHIIRVRFDGKNLLPLYACEYLNSPGGRRHLLRSGKTTSGLNTISVSEVRAAPIASPPLTLQRDFSDRVAAIAKVKVSQRAALARLDALFAALQHRAFRGEL